MPHVDAEDFGDAGVIRRTCDNPSCGKLITLCWKGRYGEYCSNECLKAMEKGDKTMKTETTDTNSPIVAGGAAPAPAKKGKTVKKAAKKTTKKTAKKAPAKTAKANGEAKRNRSSYADEAVIKVKSTDHGLRGNRAEALDAMKDGMTIEKYRTALDKKGGRFSTYFGWAMKTALDKKLITVQS